MLSGVGDDQVLKSGNVHVLLKTPSSRFGSKSGNVGTATAILCGCLDVFGIVQPCKLNMWAMFDDGYMQPVAFADINL